MLAWFSFTFIYKYCCVTYFGGWKSLNFLHLLLWLFGVDECVRMCSWGCYYLQSECGVNNCFIYDAMELFFFKSKNKAQSMADRYNCSLKKHGIVNYFVFENFCQWEHISGEVWAILLLLTKLTVMFKKGFFYSGDFKQNQKYD